MAAIRRHRIVERFLSDMLGYPWNEADRLATSFEHELPQEVEDRLFVALHRPSTCPHGFPIPEPEVGYIPEMPPLYDLEPGDAAEVAVPGSTDPAVVAFLDTLGLRPGVRVEVREKHPFDGPLVIRVDGHDRTVGHRLANQIYVKVDERDAPPAPSRQHGHQDRKEHWHDAHPRQRRGLSGLHPGRGREGLARLRPPRRSRCA